MRKYSLLCILLSFFVLLPLALHAAGHKSVINDEWEEDWETAFFEKEAVKKQVLNREKKKIVRPVLPAGGKMRPLPQSLYKVEEPKAKPAEIENLPKEPPVEYEEENAVKSTNYNFSQYAGLKFVHGTIDMNGSPSFNASGAEIIAGIKKDTLRAEASLLYNFQTKMNNNSQQKLSIAAFIINAFADMPIINSPEFMPYMGFGLGVSNSKMKQISSNESGVSMAWQSSAGLTYLVNSQINLDIGLRYINYGTPKIKNIDYEFASLQFIFGVRAFF